MAAELSMVISAKDMASGVLRGVTGPLDGLAKATTAPTSALGGLLGTVAKFAIPAIGIAGLIGSLVDMGGAASEAELSAKGLESVLASTKGVAGITADAANDLAASLSRVTKFDDDAIVGGESLLLTFTNIGKDVFPGATEAMLDMSQALGQDMKSSAIQLGKALNDPVAGVSALRKVGVSLTDAQEALVAKMVKVGDVAGAQKVILKELKTEFGGAARAAGETFGGKLAILTTQIGNIKEAIGGALTGALSGLVGALIPVVTYLGSVISSGDTLNDFLADVPAFLQPFVKGLGEAVLVIQDVAHVIGELVAGNVGLQDFAARLGEIFGVDVSPFTNAIKTVVDTVTALLGYLSADNQVDLMAAWFGPDIGPKIDEVVRAVKGIGEVIGFVIGDIKGLLNGDQTFSQFISNMIIDLKIGAGFWLQYVDGLAGIIGKLLPIILAEALEWGKALVDWIGPQIPPALAQLAIFGSQLLEWIGAQAAPILTQLGQWAASFVAWIQPAAIQFLKEWPGVLDSFLDWIADVAPRILLELGNWALAFVAWVAPNIPAVLAALALIAIAVLVFVAETALTIGLKLGLWGAKFIGFVVTEILPTLPSELAKIATAVIAFIADAVPVIVAKLKEWGGAVLGFVVTHVIPTFGTELAKIGTAVTTYISGAVQGIVDSAKAWGAGIISGLLSGASGLGGQLRDAIWNHINGMKIDIGIFHLANGAFSMDTPTIPSISGAVTSMLNNFRVTVGMFTITASGVTVAWPALSAPTISAPRSSLMVGSGGGGFGATVNVNNPILLTTDRAALRQLAQMLKPELDSVLGYSLG